MKKIIINQNNSGERVDKFLARGFFLNTKTSRGEIDKSIKARNILINGQKVKSSYILKTHDLLKINLIKKKLELVPNKKIKFKIIYQDENLIIINKPAGLQVHSAKLFCDYGAKPSETLVNGLLYKFPEIKTVGDKPENRPGIVHRLDRDTSGIIVVVKNQKTFLKMKEKFKNREVKKTYWALVIGNLGKPNEQGIIDRPIARAANYKKQVIAGEKTKTKKRSAITRYKVLKAWDNFSLLEVYPQTGRMHQIRVHLASLGCPIVGDKKYCLKNISKIKNVSKQLLHAKKIEFKLENKKYKFEAKLPEAFQVFLNYLDENAVKS